MKKLFFATLFFALKIALAQEPVREFRNGSVWTGAGFETRTFWTRGGKITFKSTGENVLEAVELGGKWVVPAFGDAASQNFDGGIDLDFVLKNHIDEGFFYVLQLQNSQKARADVAGQTNNPAGPDVAFGNGTLTCTGGEPSGQVELRALQMQFPTDWASRVNVANRNPLLFDDAYWYIESPEMLDAKWPKIAAMQPDFIQISMRDVKNEARKGSIRSDLAKRAVKKAHKAKLRVFASIETADDFRAGLEAGVDGFTNLPGATWDGQKAADAARYELLPEDVKKAKKKKVFVVPTFVRSQSTVGEMSPEGQFLVDTARQKRVCELQKTMLKRLSEAGVPIALGVDELTKTPRSELMYLQQLGALSNEMLFRSLVETTSKVIFPKRKLGAIREGFEADFVVLTGTPLANLLNTRRIEMAVKQGKILKNQLKKG